MTQYASGTSVPVDRTKTEIEATLRRYGAEKFAYMVDDARAAIGFQINGRSIRMQVTIPKPEEFARTERGRPRSADARSLECAKATRQRWRALLLIVKAKLEAVESGITTFDTEWLPYLVLPTGRTVSETVIPQLDSMLAGGNAGFLALGMDPGT